MDLHLDRCWCHDLRELSFQNALKALSIAGTNYWFLFASILQGINALMVVYLQYSVATTISLTMPKYLNFPAVTICSPAPFSCSKFSTLSASSYSSAAVRQTTVHLYLLIYQSYPIHMKTMFCLQHCLHTYWVHASLKHLSTSDLRKVAQRNPGNSRVFTKQTSLEIFHGEDGRSGAVRSVCPGPWSTIALVCLV